MATTLTFSGIRPELGKYPARRAAEAPSRSLAIGLAAAVIVAAIIAAALSGEAGNASPATGLTRAPGASPIAGVFTAEYVEGMPVYRLPPITVVASRKAELARIAREARGAPATHAPREAEPMLAGRRR